MFFLFPLHYNVGFCFKRRLEINSNTKGNLRLGYYQWVGQGVRRLFGRKWSGLKIRRGLFLISLLRAPVTEPIFQQLLFKKTTLYICKKCSSTHLIVAINLYQKTTPWWVVILQFAIPPGEGGEHSGRQINPFQCTQWVQSRAKSAKYNR
jgi:hypothetical protein